MGKQIKLSIDNTDTVDVSDLYFQSETTKVRNLKRHDYSYLAHLTEYRSAHDIERIFLDLDVQHTTEDGKKYVSYMLPLANLKVNEIYEFRDNERVSGKYSNVTSCVFRVVEIDNTEITIETYPSAHKAFLTKLKNTYN
ncbi:MAG: hypothetical protein VKL60_00385 [Sphaerospermopsis sp.]|nr:hypothetical protein [Sphaerospermopsis sp.]